MTPARQEINLYQPVAKGVRGMLSAASTTTMMVLVAATLLGLWAFASWQVRKLEAAALVVRNQQQAQAAMSAAAGPQLDALTDEDLQALIDRLSASVSAKSQALALLDGEAGKQDRGFSARLRAFGERHIDGIWLDRLTLGAGVESISVSGSTLSPDSVPRYLRSLAADPALRGGQIDEFVIEKPAGKQHAAGGRLSFRAGHQGLVSHAPAAAAEAAGAPGENG
jgi:hypothetical protein